MIRLDPNELKARFNANFETGQLYHYDWAPVKTWDNGHGYRAFRLDPWPSTKMVLVHRVMVVLYWGYDIAPGWVVDHIDHNRANNAISNLQVMTKQQNNMKKKPYLKNG